MATLVYEYIFHDGSALNDIDWVAVGQSGDWVKVNRTNIDRVAAGDNSVWFVPPWTYYYTPHKFNLLEMHSVGEHLYLVYKHTKEAALVLLRACPEIVLSLKSITSVGGAVVEVTWASAFSGEPWITLALDKTRRYSLVTVEREVRLLKMIQNKLTFMFEDSILRKNTVIWHPHWQTVQEPTRRLRRRTAVRGQLTLDQYFP